MPIGTNLVSVGMPANSALIGQFRKAKVMTAFAQGQLFQFNLNLTAELLPSLVNCVSSVKKNGVASAGEFVLPKSVAKPAVAAGPGQPGSPPSKPGKTVNQTGTGFVISSSGHVVTNQHVIDGCVGDIRGNLSGEAAIRCVLFPATKPTTLLCFRRRPRSRRSLPSGTSRSVRAIASWRSVIRSMDC